MKNGIYQIIETGCLLEFNYNLRVSTSYIYERNRKRIFNTPSRWGISRGTREPMPFRGLISIYAL